MRKPISLLLCSDQIDELRRARVDSAARHLIFGNDHFSQAANGRVLVIVEMFRFINSACLLLFLRGMLVHMLGRVRRHPGQCNRKRDVAQRFPT